MTDPDDLLDEREVAELMLVAASTVERWRREGRGPAWIKISGAVGKTGGRIRYRRSDVEDYLRSNRVDPRSVQTFNDVPIPGLANDETNGGINGETVGLDPA